LTQRPMSCNGESLPWMNYTVIGLIEERLPATARVLEYGSGASTFWWSKRSALVISVESDPYWYERCRNSLPSNVNLRLASPDESYPNLAEEDRSKSFDVVIIDGHFRVECAHYILPYMSSSAIIVWDDAERSTYQLGYDFLKKSGFRSLRFFGPKPAASKPAATEIFYRDNNILGI